jgi:hypothetical protein
MLVWPVNWKGHGRQRSWPSSRDSPKKLHMKNGSLGSCCVRLNSNRQPSKHKSQIDSAWNKLLSGSLVNPTQVTEESLRTGRSWDRISAGARFSVPNQTGPEAHLASYAMDTGSFPRVKRPGRGFDPHPHLALRLK